MGTGDNGWAVWHADNQWLVLVGRHGPVWSAIPTQALRFAEHAQALAVIDRLRADKQDKTYIVKPWGKRHRPANGEVSLRQARTWRRRAWALRLATAARLACGSPNPNYIGPMKATDRRITAAVDRIAAAIERGEIVVDKRRLPTPSNMGGSYVGKG
jgi:hypothetical protein